MIRRRNQKENIYPQNYIKMDRCRRSQRQWLAAGKQAFLVTAGQLCIWNSSGCDSLYRPMQVQATANPSPDRAGGPKIPLLAEELLASGRVFFKVWPLVGRTCFGEWPHDQQYVSNTVRLSGFRKELGYNGRGGGW